MKLSNAKAKEATNETGKAIWLYDDELTGFALSVSPRGKKTWYIDAWANGRKNREKLGVWPNVTATEARDQAKIRLGEYAKGTDYQRKAKARKLTVGDLWEHWYLYHSKPKKRTHERDRIEYERYVKPVLHHILIADVERSDVEKMLTNIQGEHSIGAANKTRSLLSAMFEYALKQDWVIANPVWKTHRPTYEPRERFLRESEVKAFFDALDSLRSQRAKDFLRLLIFTGQRRDNVASMEWAELELEAGIWDIPRGKYKGKKPHAVPLTSASLEILNRRHAERLPNAKYVFPGRGRRGYYAWPKAAWERILELSGIENLRMHDLRRSLGAWQNAGGENIKIIQQTLGHASVAITAAVYTPVDGLESVRKSVEAVNARMIEAAKGGEK